MQLQYLFFFHKTNTKKFYIKRKVTFLLKPLINSELFFDLLSDSDESDNVLKNESTVQSETEEKLKVWESDSEPEEPVTKS